MHFFESFWGGVGGGGWGGGNTQTDKNPTGKTTFLEILSTLLCIPISSYKSPANQLAPIQE